MLIHIQYLGNNISVISRDARVRIKRDGEKQPVWYDHQRYRQKASGRSHDQTCNVPNDTGPVKMMTVSSPGTLSAIKLDVPEPNILLTK